MRNEKEYFDDIQDVKVTKDMLDLAKHIVEQKSGSFEPEKFEDRYESALVDLINQKRNGLPTRESRAEIQRQRHQPHGCVKAQPRQRETGRPCAKAKGKKPRKAVAGQREMLLPISGKRAKEAPKKAERPVRAAARSKKAG